MAEERQYDDLVGKPLFDILSKLPSKSLLRFRCVSKLWREYIDDSYFVSVHDKQVIEYPTPIMFYESKLAETLCFHTIESDTTNHVLKAKNKVPVFNKKLFSRTSRTTFVGSCNGLVLFQTEDPDDRKPTFTLIHPTNKQCYVLPELPLSLRWCGGSCGGLGFDSSTNTFKMVHVALDPNNPYDDQCTMVHVFGTNSWREIPKVPSNIYGEAIFAHGCLHWLEDYDYREDNPRQVIWFDVKKEEFGFIKPPKTLSNPSKRLYSHHSCDHLVNLDGQVGYFSNETTEVWVLNHKKEWVLHCNFEDHDFPDDEIEVLGCLNKAGDILIKLINWRRGKEMFYIYHLKNRDMHQARIDGLDLEDGSKMNMVFFPSSLCDIITNSNLFKKKKELEENMKAEIIIEF